VTAFLSFYEIIKMDFYLKSQWLLMPAIGEFRVDNSWDRFSFCLCFLKGCGKTPKTGTPAKAGIQKVLK